MIDFHALPVFSRPCVTYFTYRTGNYGKTGSTVLFPVPSPPLMEGEGQEPGDFWVERVEGQGLHFFEKSIKNEGQERILRHTWAALGNQIGLLFVRLNAIDSATFNVFS